MKRLKEICIITLIIFVIGITSSFAATGTSNTNGLRMRAEPSTDGEIITNINNGEAVEIIETNGSWYKVKFKEFEGYVHSDYIEAEGETKPVETDPEPEVNTPEVELPEEEPVVVYPIEIVTESDAKVYIMPSVTSSIIRGIEQGKTVTVNNKVGKWSYISYEGSTGWIRTYLLENNVATNENTESNNEEETPSVANTNTLTSGYVNVSEAVVRETASSSGNILGGLTLNAEVKILAEEDDWYKIEYNGGTAYIAKRLISESQSATNRGISEPRQEVLTGYVNVGVANVRKSATTGSTILVTLKQKAKVTIVGEELDFYKIEINDDIGYIAKRLVSDSLDEITAMDEQAGSASVSTGSGTGQNVVDYAKQYLGYKYVSGGTTPSGFDCTGFVYYIYNNCGYSLSRSCASQAASGVSVSKANLQPGDLVFFNNNSDGSIGHVGIYIGSGNFIHAANPTRGVVIDTINSGYYYTYYYSARRVV